jgi:flagellar motility protein MotE (MotC chaperone)
MIRLRPKPPQGRGRAPRSRPSVLLILAALLAASGAIRIGDGVGQALAETAGEAPVSGTAARGAGEAAAEGADAVQPETDGTQAAAGPVAAAPGEQAAADGAQGCTADPGTAAMLTAIKARNDGLDRREARIADRERAVELAQTAIEARLAALVTAEEELAQTLTMADTAAEEDVARLVAVYENMKPKDAIPVFAEMDPDFAAGFLGRMRADAAAAVLSGLDPKVAYTISAILAGRNANAPAN